MTMNDIRPAIRLQTQATVLDAVRPKDVLEGVAAHPGLVVLSGVWGGGGLVIADAPTRVVEDHTALSEVFAGTPEGDSSEAQGANRVGGGWFGWLGYPPPANTFGGCWFGYYPNIVRYSATEDL